METIDIISFESDKGFITYCRLGEKSPREGYLTGDTLYLLNGKETDVKSIESAALHVTRVRADINKMVINRVEVQDNSVNN